MLIAAMINECDVTGKIFETPVMGYHFFARGATGRVCHVLNVSKESGRVGKVSTLEEVETWAESVPGGYLDY